MDTILQEISRAMQSKSYYMGLMLALAIPDICAALESEDGRSRREQYKDWFNRHLASKLRLTDDDCYSLRCGLLHQGRSELVKQGASYARVIFQLPNPAMISVHNCVMNDALVFDAFQFCMEIAAAAQKWFQAAQHLPNVKKNYTNLLQYRPNGIAPYIVGLPVIA
jgi:hypothetical protein